MHYAFYFDNTIDLSSGCHKCYNHHALLLSSRNDSVEIDQSLKSEYPYIKEHYDEAGFHFSDEIQWFSTGATSFLVSNNISNLYCTVDINDSKNASLIHELGDKNKFIKLAQTNDLLTAETMCCSSSDQVKSDDLSYPIVFKISSGSARHGTYYCATAEELHQARIKHPHHDFQIQQYYPHDSLYCLVCRIENISTCSIINFMSIRSLHPSDLFHGSHTTSLSTIECLPEKIAVQYNEFLLILAKHGVRGVMTFDLLKHNDQFLAIECNPRHGGITYASLFCFNNNIKNWCFYSLILSRVSIQQLQLHRWYYRKSTGLGIIIVTWDVKISSSFRFILAGNENQQKVIYSEITNHLKKNNFLTEAQY